MNSGYPPQNPPPHQMSRVPNEGPYRPSAGPPPPPPGHYPPQHHQQHMPIPHPSQLPARQYSDPTANPYAAQRAPIPDNMAHGGERSLVPGQPPQPREPQSIIREEHGRRYELRVVQQPRRARMCGFGDKDRRPITPPPCVQLIITDIATNKEVDMNDIEHSLMILTVDLWDASGTHEVNLVHHGAVPSPSISASLPVSYQETQYVTATSNPASNGNAYNPPHQGQPYNPFPGQPQVNPYPGPQAPQYGPAAPPQYGPGPSSQYAPAAPQFSPFPPQHQQPHSGYPNGGAYPPQNGYGPQTPAQGSFYTTGTQIHALGATANGDYPGPPPQQFQPRQYQPEPAVQRSNTSNSPPGGMFTRNLIGSLAASASRLTDTTDRIGIWFVLQDLSVRTEGEFRLRFSYCNVALPTIPGVAPPPPQQSQVPGTPAGTSMVSLTPLNTGKAPVLAQVFSEPFTVYSAKRFPGVVESTDLSKIFATQGIKIPIRKDGPGKGDRDREDDD